MGDHCLVTELFLLYFGVREDAVATAKEGLRKGKNFEVKRETLSAGFWGPNYPVSVTFLKL